MLSVQEASTVVDKDAHGKQQRREVRSRHHRHHGCNRYRSSQRGLQDGQEIVIGPYKTLRTLKNGTLLKRDTAAPCNDSI